MPQIPPTPKTFEAPRVWVETYESMKAAAEAESSTTTTSASADSKKEAR